MLLYWQKGGARVRMDVDAKTRWECVKLMNQRIVTLFTEFRIPQTEDLHEAQVNVGTHTGADDADDRGAGGG